MPSISTRHTNSPATLHSPAPTTTEAEKSARIREAPCKLKSGRFLSPHARSASRPQCASRIDSRARQCTVTQPSRRSSFLSGAPDSGGKGESATDDGERRDGWRHLCSDMEPCRRCFPAFRIRRRIVLGASRSRISGNSPSVNQRNGIILRGQYP